MSDLAPDILDCKTQYGRLRRNQFHWIDKAKLSQMSDLAAYTVDCKLNISVVT